MQETINPTVREAVGVFNDARKLQHALDALEERGFMRQEIGVYANELSPLAQDSELGRHADDVKDDPSAERQVPIPVEILGEMEGSLIGAPMYISAVGGAVAAAAAGASILFIIAAAVTAGVAGALVGYGLAKVLGRRYQESLNAQMRRGGVVVWVSVREDKMQDVAVDVLRQFSAQDIHVHDVPLHGRTIN